MTKRKRFGIIAITVAAISSANIASASAADIGNPAIGERIARSSCASCHQVAPDQDKPGGVNAPPLHLLADDPAVTEFRIRRFLQTPHRVMPNFILKAEETDDIVAYILGLKNNDRRP